MTHPKVKELCEAAAARGLLIQSLQAVQDRGLKRLVLNMLTFRLSLQRSRGVVLSRLARCRSKRWPQGCRGHAPEGRSTGG